MEIGYETNKGQKLKPTIQDVAFQNITVLHNFHKPIHNADDCAVSGVRYRNVIEVQVSNDNEKFTTVVPEAALTFDPAENNCS